MPIELGIYVQDALVKKPKAIQVKEYLKVVRTVGLKL
jgi:hypothetical protein